MNFLSKAISNYKIILAIVLLFALAASFQSYFQQARTFGESTIKYTNYNNYVIFKQSFIHLIENKDLYQLYPKEHWDLFKYSPTFSLFFGALAIFPDLIGLNLWNILNAITLMLAVYYLPKVNLKQKGLIVLIFLIELMTSMQNEQSNALIAGLIILAFGLLERQHYFIAAFCVVFSVFIKLFGIVGFALFLFYPQKWKLILYTTVWIVILFLLPLLVVDFQQLKLLYLSWGNMLEADHSGSYGFSVMGWLQSWFGFAANKLSVVAAGVILFLLPLMRFDLYKKYLFRILTLSSVLLWIVIFNHKAESPTFVIAMAGVSIWFIIGDKNLLNSILFFSALLFTSLSPTDIFPRFLREEFVIPYSLKVVPCILIWLVILYKMIVMKNEINELQKPTSL
jgi:hypothetical protein